MAEWVEVTLAALATVAGLLLAWLFVRRKASQSLKLPLPPGPKGWPILGCLSLLGTRPHQALYDLSKQYGPLMFIYLGSVKTLVVSSPKFAEEVLRIHDTNMASRPVPIVARLFSYNASDIGWAPYGQRWRVLRKVCTAGLLAPNRIAQFRDIRQREVMDTLHFMLEESERGKAVGMTECFTKTTMNNMTQIMMSQSYCVLSSDSSALSETSTWYCFKQMGELMGAFNIADYVPFLKPFDPQGFHKRIKIVHDKVDKLFEDLFAERRQRRSINNVENQREDFVDALLASAQTKEIEDRLSMDEVKALLLDMVLGGGDTSAVTALWALSEVMKHPGVLRKLQEELDSVAGLHRLVQEEDLPKLQYLNAVVKETLRLHTPSPLMVPHFATEDCEIGGFHIPAKTQVFVNIWGMHRDPDVWERALEFVPERFLNCTTDFRGQDFDFLPFGSGRRVCPGINFGALMVTYPLAVLLHAFDWALPDGQKPEEVDMTDRFGVTLCRAVPLRVLVKARLPHHVLYPAQEVSKQ